MHKISKKNMFVVTGILLLMLITTTVVAYENGDGEPANSDVAGYADGEKQGGEMFGQFELEGKKMMGGYTGFELAPGEILNYTLGSDKEAVFARVRFGLQAWTQSEYQLQGAVFKCEKEGARVMSHNNPSAILYVEATENLTVEIEPAEGVEIGEEEDGSLPVEGLSVKSMIRVREATMSMDGETLRIEMKEGSCLMYMVQNDGESSQFQNAYQNAVMSGKIDGEMQISSGSEEGSQHFPYKGGVDMQVTEVEDGKRVRIQVESQEKQGKVVAFRMDGEVLSGEKMERIRVSFDGDEIEDTENPEEVIGATGDKPMYCIEKNEDGQYQAMVYVPEFSTHNIEFQTVNEEETPGFALILVLIAVVIGVIIWTLITRKRR